MQQQLPAGLRLSLAEERRARQAREASEARSAAARPRRLRTSLGLALVRLGQRLAAEPRLQPARPR